MRQMTEAEKLFDQVLEKYGAANQMVKCMEEMSELTKEVCKAYYGQIDREHIAEEIADVEIMLEQMVQLFQLKSGVILQRTFKLKRLAERVEDKA